MSLTENSNVNDRFLIPPGSSITNMKNTFNDFVTQIQNSSFMNILKNSRLTDHFAGNPNPYAWNIDAGVTIDTTNPDTIINFTGISQEIAQPITEILTPLEQYLLPSTEYLAIFDISPENNCEVGLSYDAGLVNLLGSGAVSGSDYNALHSTVYGGSSGITYFVFKTAEDFSGITFYIKNLASGSNAVTLNKLSLVEGTLNLMDSIESNLFLDHIRYNDNALHWEYTNDGITWLPFLEDITPITNTASYTPVHDQIPILSGTGGTQLAGGILPIGNGYLSPVVDLTIGGTGAIDLNTCTISGVIYTADGTVTIPNAPFNNFDGTAWWTGDLNGNGCQFAVGVKGDLWSRTYNSLLWTDWILDNNNNSVTENLLINGNMDVWRRGGVASPFLLANGTTAYTADRWKISSAAYYASNISISKNVLQPVSGVYLVPGSRNCFSMYHPALNADVTLATRTAIEQRLEDITRFVNTDITFSFWATSDTNMTGTVYADIVPTGIPAVVGFNCNTGMKNPFTAITDTSYIYVANFSANTITRYDKATGIEDSSGFLCNTGMSNPVRIALDATYLYVVNNANNTVTRYNKSTGTQNSSGFLCNTGMSNPHGIVLDATYLYVANDTSNTVTRYYISSGTQNSSGFLCNTGMNHPYGITIDSTYLYVANNASNTVTRYYISSGIQNSSGFLCNTGMNHPQGITIDATYLYITNELSNTVTRYDIASGTLDNSGFLCNINMNHPCGLTIDSTYLYVANDASNTVTRYDIASGTLDNSGASNPLISAHDYEQNINFVAGVWQQYSVTFSISNPSGLFSVNPTQPDFVAIGIIPNISILNATPAYNFSFTQAQLEYGKSVTVFGGKTITEEELLCARYFQTSYLKDITPGTINQNRKGAVNSLTGTGTLAGSPTNTCLLTYIQLIPKMRITPNVTIYAPAAGTAGSIEVDSTHPYAITPTIYASDGAITDIVATTNKSSAGITGDNATEWYQFHYTADAEL